MEQPFFRRFSKRVAGEFSECEFVRVNILDNLSSVEYRQEYVQRQCAKCGFVNTTTELYRLVKVEIYKPVSSGATDFEVWLGHTEDSKLVFIEHARKPEVTAQIEKGKQ